MPEQQTGVDSDALSSHVVRVEAPEGGQLGTGYFVTDVLVLTCAHVVAGRPLVRLRSLGGTAVDGRVVASSPVPADRSGLWPFPDLALVRVPAAAAGRPVFLAATEPGPDETCSSWGFSRREDGRTPPGSPARFRFEGVEHDRYFKLALGQAAPGLSGAPLLSPGNRAVVGTIAASRHTGSDLGGWASPVSALSTQGFEAFDVLAVNHALHTRQRYWHQVLPAAGTDEILDRPWLDIPFERLAHSSVADLLQAEFGVVPYLFHDEALDDFERWCARPDPLALTVISGPGGSGKTRFAIEACRRMRRQDWAAGMRRGDNDTALAELPAPRLIVIDYAERVGPTQLDAFLDRLQARASALNPVRLLLITRPAGNRDGDVLAQWRSGLRAARRAFLDQARLETRVGASLSEAEAGRLHREAASRFARAWGVSPSALAHRPRGRDLPLDVLFDALDAILPGSSGSGSATDRVLLHEEGHWVAGGSPPDDPSTLRTYVCLATLAGADDRAEADALVATLPWLDRSEMVQRRQGIVTWLASLYRGSALLNPVRPDRLGEHLVATVLEQQPDGGVSLLSRILGLPADSQAARCLETLTRLVAAYDSQMPVVTQVLADRHPALVLRAERNVRGEQLGQIAFAESLVRLLSRLPDELFAERVAGGAGLLRDLVVSFVRLGDLMTDRGRPGLALALYERALKIADAQRDGLLESDLFGVWLRLGDLALAEGRLDDARRRFFDVYEQADRHLRALPNDPDYVRDAAMCCTRLGDVETAAGNDALARSYFLRSLELREMLSADDDHARGIEVTCNKLGDLAASADEAGPYFERALAIAERLLASAPGNLVYQQDLAACYERCAHHARRGGRPAEAARFTGRAVALRTALHLGNRRRPDFAEDLCAALYLEIQNGADTRTGALRIRDLLDPFARARVLTPLGVELLTWARMVADLRH